MMVIMTATTPVSYTHLDVYKRQELGTRHRAAIGISEVTDSFTIVVSEETGAVSVAQGGRLWRNVDQDVLKKRLVEIQGKEAEYRRFRLWKGRHRDERKAGQ